MYRENPEETDDRQYYDYHLDRNGSPLESELKQQTAVMKLLQYILVDCRNKDGVIQFSAHETFGEYLEMEKQEILDAWEDGQGSFPTRNAEQYYNETFGGEEMTVTNNNNNPVTPKPNNTTQASDEMNSRLAIEKKLWDSMVEWDKNNKR